MLSSNGRGQPRVTLVLGGGWILGGSFHAGVILALRDALGIDARHAATVVGTSSGAVATALIGAGVSPEDLYRREHGLALSEEGQELLGRVRRRSSGNDRRSMPNPLPAAPGVLARAASRSGRQAPAAIAAGLLPRGTVPHNRLRHYVDDLTNASWPDGPNLRFCAIDMRRASRVVIDRSWPTTPGLAVAASCAIPGLHAPVRIGELELLDGALHSADNLDCVAEDESDLIVVSSPLAADSPVDWVRPLALLRNTVRQRTELDRRTVDGRPVVVVQPGPTDVRVMGADLNDRRRRGDVARRAYLTACAALADGGPGRGGHRVAGQT